MSRIDAYSNYQQFAGSYLDPNDIKGARNGKPDPRIPQPGKDSDAAIYEPSEKATKPVTYAKPSIVSKNAYVAPDVQLSDAAKALLDELKEKYGADTDIIIANYSTDEEANELMSHGKKSYSVLIDPELLEQMAADESVKEQYMNQIDEAKGQMNDMLEKLGEDADKVKSIGISIDANGTISYFAQLKDASQKRSAEIEKGLEEKREEKKAEKKEHDEERLEKQIENNHKKFITADSIEDLLKKLQ